MTDSVSEDSALEAERWLLGALLLEDAPLDEVARSVSPLDFVELRHRQLFEALTRLQFRSEPVDFVTVFRELDDAGHLDADGRRYIVELAQEVTTTAHAIRHAQLVAAQGQRRRALDLLQGAPTRFEGRRVEETTEVLEGIMASLQAIAASCPADGMETVSLAEVESKPVAWLWPNRIALGKLTLLIGDPGLGKSTVALDMAARVSRGAEWPDCSDVLPPGRVLIASAEDGLEDTIRPRAEAAGAVLDRIEAVRGVLTVEGERPFSLEEDLRRLDARVAATEGLRMLLVDPLSAFVGRTDTHRDAEVRRILTPLAALAERHGIAVVGIVHLNKGQAQAAVYRAMGSIAFMAAARSAWAVTRDPEDQERRFLVQVKNNLGTGPSLAFRLDPAPGPAGTTVPRVAWERDPVAVTAEQALGPVAEGREGPLERACAWLRAELASGPVPAKVLIGRAGEDGISKRTLDRAKEALGVKASKKGMGGPWAWRLPDDCHPANSKESATFEESGDLRSDVTDQAVPGRSRDLPRDEECQPDGAAAFAEESGSEPGRACRERHEREVLPCP